VAIFLDTAPPRGWEAAVTGRADELFQSVGREIFVSYGEGMGSSRLKIPVAKAGTARNINTVARLAEMARG
jgi:uncharacterized protein (DUF1697 family)